jgi:hypothetical protein
MRTIDEEINAITTTNTIYNDYELRWEYLLESYLGGDEFRDSQHLTRYVNETPGEYAARIRATHLENHCASVIQVYNSFLFRTAPERELGSLDDLEVTEQFLKDADLDGRSLNAFMKDVATWASVFGHCWIIIAKPNLELQTLSEELALGVRPYANLMNPLTVRDWAWSRTPMGRYELTYIKYIEEINGSVQTVKEWTPETVRTVVVDIKERYFVSDTTEVNQLGYIPCVLAYNARSTVRGIGVSDITDIADAQRTIYNCLSEIEQSIRVDSHPSLVKTPDTQAGVGAGSIIQIPENLDPGLKPYILEYNGASVDAILKQITHIENAIDKMANTGAVRATESRTMSGVAMQTEFQLLNARLADKAQNLELAEEQIWRIFADYQGVAYDGQVTYPGSFNIRDEDKEFEHLKMARDTATDPAVLRVIDEQLMEALGEEYTRLPFVDPNPQLGRTYPDGEPINANLPAAYQPAANPDVPAGQNCDNCEYYRPGELYCTKFDAPVRAVYWCAKWEPYEDMAETPLTPAQSLEIQRRLMQGETNAEIMADMPGVTVNMIATAAAIAVQDNV